MAVTILTRAPRFERRRARKAHHQELMHIRDLVRLRKILARNGATADEIRSYDAEIDRQRRLLRAPRLVVAL